MQIDPTSAATAAANTGQAKAPTVSYDSFLRLLIAQMKNQDPTNPTDSTQYLSQLASFSAVEQAVQTNSKLDALVNNSLLAQADSVLGRTLTSADGAVTGVVKAVTISSSGVVATLDSGAQVPVAGGVTIR